jgi:hypothetical protein
MGHILKSKPHLSRGAWPYVGESRAMSLKCSKMGGYGKLDGPPPGLGRRASQRRYLDRLARAPPAVSHPC